jgi:hypothetical protein
MPPKIAFMLQAFLPHTGGLSPVPQRYRQSLFRYRQTVSNARTSAAFRMASVRASVEHDAPSSPASLREYSRRPMKAVSDEGEPRAEGAAMRHHHRQSAYHRHWSRSALPARQAVRGRLILRKPGRPCVVDIVTDNMQNFRIALRQNEHATARSGNVCKYNKIKFHRREAKSLRSFSEHKFAASQFGSCRLSLTRGYQ